MPKVPKVQAGIGLLIPLLILAVGDVAEVVGLEPFLESALWHAAFFGGVNAVGSLKSNGKLGIDSPLAVVELVQRVRDELLVSRKIS